MLLRTGQLGFDCIHKPNLQHSDNHLQILYQKHHSVSIAVPVRGADAGGRDFVARAPPHNLEMWHDP